MESAFTVPAHTSAFGETNLPQEREFPITHKEAVSHDSYLFRFGLEENETLGVPIGGCVKFIAEINGEHVERSYTPINDVKHASNFEIVIKIYRPCEKFPDGGKMTRYLESLSVGDKVKIRGPLGRIQYHGHGKFTIKENPQLNATRTKIGLIAGGTGIAPCWRLLQSMIKNNDGTEVTLLFANHTPIDILLKQQLDSLAA